MAKTKAVVLIVVLAGLAIAALTLPIKDYTRSFVEWVDSLGEWGPVMLALAYIPATVLFIPGSPLTLAGGALFGPVVATIAVSLGSVAGSTAAFLIGRFLARDWVTTRVERDTRFKALDDAVGRSGFKLVLLTRLSPVFPYNLLGYAYGLTRVRVRDYMLASWIGMLPGTAMYAYLGHAARAAIDQPRQRGMAEWSMLGFGLAATIILVLLIARTARQALREVTTTQERTRD